MESAPRTRSPAELERAMAEIRAAADRFLARKAKTVAAWNAYKSQLEGQDAAARIIRAAAEADRRARALFRQSTRNLANPAKP